MRIKCNFYCVFSTLPVFHLLLNSYRAKCYLISFSSANNMKDLDMQFLARLTHAHDLITFQEMCVKRREMRHWLEQASEIVVIRRILVTHWSSRKVYNNLDCQGHSFSPSLFHPHSLGTLCRFVSYTTFSTFQYKFYSRRVQNNFLKRKKSEKRDFKRRSKRSTIAHMIWTCTL